MSQSKEPDSTEALIGLELNLTTPRIETESTSNVSSEAATEQSVSSRFPIPPQECALESEPFVPPQQTQERHISFQEEEEGVGDLSSTEGLTADLKVNKEIYDFNSNAEKEIYNLDPLRTDPNKESLRDQNFTEGVTAHLKVKEEVYDLNPKGKKDIYDLDPKVKNESYNLDPLLTEPNKLVNIDVYNSEDKQVLQRQLPKVNIRVPQTTNEDSSDTETTYTEESKSFLWKTIDFVRYFYSTLLLLFCLILVHYGIFVKESKLTSDEYGAPPVAVFFLFWFLLLWLAMMEGGQGCLVGLQIVDISCYDKTHKITAKNTSLVHKGDNMDRFIVGRQFLVVLVIFILNLCGSAVAGAQSFGLPKLVNQIFLENGVAMMITTIVLGHLTSQVNAAVCMLDFLNNYFMLFTSYVSLGIEASGLLHAVYLVQRVFLKLADKPSGSNEPEKTVLQSIVFWAQVLFSTVVLGFALAVTLEALFKGQSGMWDGVPSWASVIIFFVLLCAVGMMEGMQIAAFRLFKMSQEELSQHSVAAANCELMFSGQNLQAFLIGRQIFVASLMFIVARVATIEIEDNEDNIFGVGNGLQRFLDTGLLGAVVLTIIGSLAWRIIASTFPLGFMSNPVVYVLIRICLILEGTGLASSAWLLALAIKKIVNLNPDEEYLEETADAEVGLTSIKEDESIEEEIPDKRLAFAKSKSKSSRYFGLNSYQHLSVSSLDPGPTIGFQTPSRRNMLSRQGSSYSFRARSNRSLQMD